MKTIASRSNPVKLGITRQQSVAKLDQTEITTT